MTQSSTPDYARAKTVGREDIPVIDLAGIGTRQGRDAAAASLVAAASEIGFFYVSGHGVSARLCADAMAASRSFFELPEAPSSGWLDEARDLVTGIPPTRLEGLSTDEKAALRDACRTAQALLPGR